MSEKEYIEFLKKEIESLENLKSQIENRISDIYSYISMYTYYSK